ncbi:alpha/beta hydrolase [Sedimentitalea sp.]|uniref:alpha/beta hydrolase n=1 Tax=Sedimentitalea sp. TaxID=2048915 RepID=UPI0032976316
MFRRLLALVTVPVLLTFATHAVAEEWGTDQSALSKRGHFFVGGEYVGPEDKQVMQGQMYVEVLTPQEVTKPYPLVLIHGAAQTATNWMLTPDGRKGWADHFVENGYIVYMVDQPARGRSAWHPEINGPLRMYTAQQLRRLFTAPAKYGKWPQANKHTQWPGSGEIGDPVFDAFYASQVESLKGNAETQEMAQNAGAALLDRIGPAVLLTHSQSGLLGWVIAEARPDLVKAIVAIEPSGPPFHNNNKDMTPARAYGITDIPVVYDPAVTDPTDIKTVMQAEPDGPDLITCTIQQEPVRKLVNFQEIPILVTTSEASYHAPYDHCTAKFLAQAGAPVQFIRLEDKGIHGNGHMVMFEKNNLEIADFLSGWIVEHAK